jgi:uncharacterized membrane protein
MLLAPPQMLVDLAAPWASAYGDSNALATIVTFLHIAPLLVGGGLAIALDRATLRLRHDEPGARARHLSELGAAHRVVLGGLALSFLSGLALFAADVETYFGSWIFWLKMGFIAVLLANGARMQGIERSLRVEGSTSAGETQWRRLRGIAVASLVLWLTITLAGVALLNFA